MIYDLENSMRPRGMVVNVLFLITPLLLSLNEEQLCLPIIISSVLLQPLDLDSLRIFLNPQIDGSWRE